MEDQGSGFSEEEGSFGWTVVSAVKDGELDVKGNESDDTGVNTRERKASNQQVFEEEEAQESQAEHSAETLGGATVGERELQATKREGKASEKEETEAVLNARIWEEEDYTKEDELGVTEKGGGILQVKEEGEAQDEGQDDREQDKDLQERDLTIQDAFLSNMTRIFPRKKQLRDLEPSPPEEPKIQQHEQQHQAARLWRVSLIATLGILGWALFCGGSIELHFCNMKEREPVLNPSMKK